MNITGDEIGADKLPEQPPPATDDVALLEMLAMRRRTPSAAVGAFFGTTGVAVRVATDRVVKDDSAEEGRDVRAEYGFLSQEKAQRAGYNGR